jgi:DNA-binding NarL/FixJ family response regulator
MRVLLVGAAAEDRSRLRVSLAERFIDVVGEFPTLAAARASHVPAEAIVVTPRSERVPLGEALTPREGEVLELLAEGLSNRTIAARLGISDQTVKFHLASISGKLGARNRTDAVRRAIRLGLVTV